MVCTLVDSEMLRRREKKEKSADVVGVLVGSLKRRFVDLIG